MALSFDLRSEIARADNDPNYLLFNGNPVPEDELLFNDLGCDYRQYDLLEKNPQIKAVLNKRKYAVIAREYEVQPFSNSLKDRKAAEGIALILKNSSFDSLRYQLLDALLKGFSVAELVYYYDQLNDLICYKFKSVSQKRWSFNYNPNSKNLTTMGFELMLRTRDSGWSGSPVPNKKFICFSWGTKAGNPYGKGLGEQLWWLNRFLKEDIKGWLLALDKFAAPTPIGTFPLGGDQDKLNRFLDNLTQGSWASIPDGYKVDFLQAANGNGYESYRQFAAFCNAEISKLVLGETLSTELGEYGSYSASQTHNNVRIELCKADADLLHECLNETLIKWLCELNFPRANPPKVFVNFDESLDSQIARQEKLAGIMNVLAQNNVTPTEAKIKEMFGDGWEIKQQDQQSISEIANPIIPNFSETIDLSEQIKKIKKVQRTGQKFSQIISDKLS